MSNYSRFPQFAPNIWSRIIDKQSHKHRHFIDPNQINQNITKPTIHFFQTCALWKIWDFKETTSNDFPKKDTDNIFSITNTLDWSLNLHQANIQSKCQNFSKSSKTIPTYRTLSFFNFLTETYHGKIFWNWNSLHVQSKNDLNRNLIVVVINKKWKKSWLDHRYLYFLRNLEITTGNSLRRN